ncbi:MAG: hypothetical protein ACXVQ3_03760 [Gaiellaceae bacterium]
MRRDIALFMGVLAAAALVVSVAIAGPPPSPPHNLHFTRCNTTIGATTPYASWGVNVTMVLARGGADNLWISEPAALAGHYRIQGYRTADAVSNTTPPAFPDWASIGNKVGQDLRIECKGYFGDTAPYSWVDSIDVRVD